VAADYDGATMGPAIPATAEGDLGRTPFAHLLAFALERQLSGALFLREPAGTEHVVAFDRGAPVKVRPGDPFARLGELLVEDGALDEATLKAALETPGMLGDVLLVGGAVTSAELRRAVDRQFATRMTRLFGLPRETTWRFFEGHGDLDEYGGEPATVDPLAVLWSGICDNAEAVAPTIDATLARLGDTPMRALGGVAVERFGFGPVEVQAVELLKLAAAPIPKLLGAGLVPEAVLRRVLYALVLTRQLEGLQAPQGAAAAGEAEPGSGNPAAEGPRAAVDDAAAISAAAALARVQLRSTVHRHGAAAPDLPGDGERAPVVVRSKVRDKRAASEVAASGEPAPISAEPPPSSRDGVPSAPSAAAPVTPRPVLAPSAAYELAKEKLEARDLGAAHDACQQALAGAPENPDYVALGVWIRAQLPQADVKTLTVELDELLRAHEAHVAARFYRGVLRKRLSDAAGAARDLRRVLELDPTHAEARQLVDGLDARAAKPQAGGLFSRLFRR
jgi:hypothetical protein